MVQDSATPTIMKIENEFKQMGAQVTALDQRMKSFNTAINTNARNFQAGVTPIKQQGDAFANLNKNLAANVVQTKSSISVLKDHVLGIGLAASGVVGLVGSFTQLEKTMIMNERVALMSDRANQKVTKVQAALNKLVKEGKQGTNEYNIKLKDLTIAQEAAHVATERSAIVQKQTNEKITEFAINAAPSAILAVTGITDVIKDMDLSMAKVKGTFTTLGTTMTGSIGGVTGLTDKLKTLGGAVLGLDGPMQGLKGNLLGLGAISAVGIVGLIALMSDLSAKFKDLKDVSSGAITPVKALGNEFDRWQNFDFTSIEGIASAVAHGIGPGIPIMGQFKKGLEAMTSATIDQTTVAGFLAARQKDVADAQKNYNDMVGLGTDAQVAAAKALLDHAKKNLELTETFAKAAKGTDDLNTAQEKYNATQKQSIALTEKYSSTWGLQIHAFEGTTPSINLASKAYLDVAAAIVKANPEIGKIIEKTRLEKQEQDDLAKALKNVTANEAKNTTEFLTLFAKKGETLQQFVARMADAKKIQDEYTASSEAANKVVQDQMNVAADLNVEDKQLIATFGNLNKSTLINTEVRAKLMEISNKQLSGFKAEELAILDLAGANDVYSAELANLADQEGDQVTQMNNLLAMSIDYTSALTDQTKNQKLVSEGFRDGIIQAKTFFDGLVKGTEQNIDFNLSLADGAEELGITSDLLAFSSGKMQQLIKDVHETATGFDDMSIASAKNTSFLKDNVLIESQLNKGLLEGMQAADDWAISNTKATAEAFAFHDQLVKVTADMLGLPVPINATNEALQKAMKTFEETHDAGLALSEMMTDDLAPAFDRVSSLIQSKSMKELRDNIKKLELPKGFTHGIDDAFKASQRAAESARKVGTAMDILTTKGMNFSKSDLTKNMKAFGNELDRLSKVHGTSREVDSLLSSLKTMSPQELGKHSKSMEFLVETINKFGFLPKDKAKEFIDMFNKEGVKMGPSATTAATGIDKLTGSMTSFVTTVAKLQDLKITKAGKKLGLDQGDLKAGGSAGVGIGGKGGVNIDLSGQKDTKQTLTVDNSQAIKAVDVVAKRIQSLSSIQPVIVLQNNQAIKAVDVLAKRIDSLTGIEPAISLQNKQAIKVVDVVAKRIDSLTNIEPSISLQNKKAIKVVDVVAKRIDSLTKIEPDISLQNNKAIKAVDVVAKRIDDLSKLNPTINVKVNVQGMPKGAAHGMHETLTEDTLIQAHKGERVDIQKSGLDQTSMRSLGASGNQAAPNNAGMMGFNGITVNNVIDLGGETIVRSFKRRLGTNLYTYGR